MKKLMALGFLSVILLAGCGTSEVTYIGKSAPSTEENHLDEVTTVTYVKDGDDITSCDFDIILGDGGSKTELSDSGQYGMEEKTGKSWSTHVSELETYVIENDAMPTLDADGKDADGVSGATISLTTFDEAFNAAEAQ